MAGRERKKERRPDQRDKICGWDEGIVNNTEGKQ